MKREELIATIEPCRSAVDFYQHREEILRHLKEEEVDEEAPLVAKTRRGGK